MAEQELCATFLEEYFPKLYAKVDPLFSAYQDAYTKPILEKTCEKIRDEIREIIKTTDLPREIKEIIR